MFSILVYFCINYLLKNSIILYMENDLNDIKIEGNPDLTNYMREFKEDNTVTERNLREKSRTCNSIRAKWVNYYFKEKDNLKRIKAKKDERLKNKLSSNPNKNSVLRMKSEDVLSQNDEVIQKLNILNERVKENISFIEHAMNVLKDLGFTIKNTYDIIKMQTI